MIFFLKENGLLVLYDATKFLFASISIDVVSCPTCFMFEMERVNLIKYLAMSVSFCSHPKIVMSATSLLNDNTYFYVQTTASRR